MKTITTLIKKDIITYTIFLLIGFCSFYLTKIVSVSPFYICYAMALLFLFLKILNNGRFQKIRNNYLPFILVLIILFYFITSIYSSSIDGLSNFFTTLLFNQLLFMIILYALNMQRNTNIVFFSILILYYVSIGVGFFDFIYRLKNATSTNIGILMFYNFKNDSAMFDDSNWVGFIFMIEFAFFVAIKDKYGKNKYISKLHLGLIFLMVVLSFSRAAILSCLIVLMYKKFQSFRKKTKIYLLFFFILLMIFLIPVVINVLLKDGSFGTKMALMNGLAYYFDNSVLLQIFLGNGAGASSDKPMLMGNCGYGAHLYLIIKVIDSGIVGIVLEFLFFANIVYLSNKRALFVLIPFYICGLSMCPTNLSYMYVLLAVLVFLEQQENLNKSINY